MKTLPGNLLDQAPGVLCHQVNTLGIMGGGIALQIRRRWPHVYEEYRSTCLSGQLNLGDVLFSRIGPGVFIANLAGQSEIGSGECHTSYEHYPQMLRAVAKYANASCLPIYLPHGIGCGLAGGNWEIMERILRTHLDTAILVKWEEA